MLSGTIHETGFIASVRQLNASRLLGQFHPKDFYPMLVDSSRLRQFERPRIPIMIPAKCLLVPAEDLPTTLLCSRGWLFQAHGSARRRDQGWRKPLLALAQGRARW